MEKRLAHQRARDAKVIGKLLLAQLGAGQQLVLDDGAGEGFGDGVGGGRFHEKLFKFTKIVYTFGRQRYSRFHPMFKELSRWA
ncbi:hypothetical protein SDC9_181146 [bioreactor metagenome]|uniref:Uncharacterized protein n=1 Tax=bioreactor metagenome TaxID=1076179 RepID=A0A645H598_9ZZZZ